MRWRSAMSLVEILVALALAVALLAAVATSLNAMSSNLRANQAQLEGLRAARIAMDLVTAQLRQADECLVYGTMVASSDGVYGQQATHISINSGLQDPRSDCNPGDYVELHLQTIALANGQTGLQIWKDSKGLTWNGIPYPNPYATPTPYVIPNVVSAQILCDISTNVPTKSEGTPPTSYPNVRAVQIQMTVAVSDQRGQTVYVPMTSSVTVRRCTP